MEEWIKRNGWGDGDDKQNGNDDGFGHGGGWADGDGAGDGDGWGDGELMHSRKNGHGIADGYVEGTS